jgi:hypothetical protein
MEPKWLEITRSSSSLVASRFLKYLFFWEVIDQEGVAWLRG